MTDTVTAAVLHGPRDLRLEERPAPSPGPREVVVEVRAVGVCGSDVHYWQHGRLGDFVVESPLVLGHETGGVVVGRGPEAHRHAIGDRVAIEPGVPDRTCRTCLSGAYNLCENVAFHATPPVDGTFVTRTVVHEDFAFTLPDNLSLLDGAMIEPLSVGLWAARKAAVAPGDDILITGAGPIGLMALQAARLRGANTLTVTDVNTTRLGLAEDLGATAVVDANETSASDLVADVLLECSGAPAVLSHGIRALGPLGRAVAVGMGGDEVAVPLAALQQREITLTGTFRYANTYPAAIAAAASGAVTLEPLVTHRMPLKGAEQALAATLDDPTAVKVVVEPTG